jgi:hypothetical protein
MTLIESVIIGVVLAYILKIAFDGFEPKEEDREDR